MSLFIIDDIPKRKLSKRWKRHAFSVARRFAERRGRFRCDGYMGKYALFRQRAFIEKHIVRGL